MYFPPFRAYVCVCLCVFQAYNKVCSRVRNCMEGYVGSGEGRLEQLAIKFSGASAERARVMLKLYEVSTLFSCVLCTLCLINTTLSLSALSCSWI